MKMVPLFYVVDNDNVIGEIQNENHKMWTYCIWFERKFNADPDSK